MLQNQSYGFDFLKVHKQHVQVLLTLGNQHKGYGNVVSFPAGPLGDFVGRHCWIVLRHHIANLAMKIRRHIAHYLYRVIAGKCYFGFCPIF